MNSQIEDANIYKDEILSVKVMTYNIRHGRDLKNNSNLDRVVDVIKSQGADVIALQEVDMGRKRTHREMQAQYIANKLNFHYHFSRTLKFKGGGEYGNAIISRYPIQDIKTLKLPAGLFKRPGRRETRNVIAATIITNTIDDKKNFIFMSTHLAIFRENVPNPNRGLTTRKLLSLVRHLEDRKLPIILAGDLNVEHSKLKPIDKPNFETQNVLSSLFPFFEFEPYKNSNAKQLDYILYRDNDDQLNIKCWAVLNESGSKQDWISDHLARTSVFTFRTEDIFVSERKETRCK